MSNTLLPATLEDARKASLYLKNYAQSKNWPRLDDCAYVIDSLAEQIGQLRNELAKARDEAT
jgi:hypothetical protein